MDSFKIIATIAVGESSAEIKAKLDSIFNNLKKFPVKVKVDQASLSSMKKQINTALTNAKINVPVNAKVANKNIAKQIGQQIGNKTVVKGTAIQKNTTQAGQIANATKNQNKAITQYNRLLKEQEKQYKALRKAENAYIIAQNRYNQNENFKNKKALEDARINQDYAKQQYNIASAERQAFQKNKHITDQMLADRGVPTWTERKNRITATSSNDLNKEQEKLLNSQNYQRDKKQQDVNKTKTTKEYRDAVNNLNSVLRQQLALENEIAGLEVRTQNKDITSQINAKKAALENINKETEKAMKEVDKYYDQMSKERQAGLNGSAQIVQNAQTANKAKRNNAIVNSITDSRHAISSLKKDFDDIDRYMTTNAKISKNSDFMKNLKDIQNNLVKAYTIPDKAMRTDAVRQAKQELKTWKSEVKAAGLETKTFGETMKSGFKKFTQWYGISNIIMQATYKVKEMWQNVKEVDAAMTELRKVTDESDATYSKFLSNAGERARETGTTISDIVNSTADFARLGYSTEDATNLADAATIYKNVGDGLTDVGEASQSIISTMKAFGVEADGAMQIVDKFNEVGKNIAQLYSNI